MHISAQIAMAAALALTMFLAGPALGNDISNSTWSETDASNNSAAPNGWQSGVMTPVQVEPTARAMMGAIKRFYNHINAVKTSGGSANTQTLTYDVAPAAYVTGDGYTFIAGFTNTGSTTLNVNSLGAKTIKRGTAALSAGEIAAGQVFSVYYDGTDFQLATSGAASSCAGLSDDGTACTANTGTSGHTLPFLDGANIWSGTNTFTAGSLLLSGASNGILKVTSTAVTSGGASTDLSDSSNLPRLNTQNTYTKSNGVTPATLSVSAGSVAVDASLSNNFTLSANDNFTLANPTNMLAGQTLNFWITQDGTGSRVMTTGTQYQAGGGSATLVLSTAANTKDLMTCVSDSTSTLTCALTLAVAH